VAWQQAHVVAHHCPGDGSDQSESEHGPGDTFEPVTGPGWLASIHGGYPPVAGGMKRLKLLAVCDTGHKAAHYAFLSPRRWGKA